MDGLLKLLSQNARFSTKQLATMLGKDEAEVRAAIEQLEKDGTIKGYKAVIDWENVDRDYVVALIDIKVIPKKDKGFEEIAEQVAQFKEVESVMLMSGGYDLSVMVSGKTLQDVAMFVSHKLSPLDDVQSTTTHFVLKRYKENGIPFSAERKDERGYASP